MSRHSADLFKRVLFLADIMLSFVAFIATLHMRQFLALHGPTWQGLPPWANELLSIPPVDPMTPYYGLAMAMIPVWGIALYWSQTTDYRVGYGRAASRFGKAVIIGTGALIIGSFLFKLDFLARTFVMAFGVVQLLTLLLGRYLLMETLAFFRRKHVDGHRVLVVGCGDSAVMCRDALFRESPWKMTLLGHVAVDDFERSAKAAPYLGDIDGLANLLDEMPVDEVVFAVPGRDPTALVKALNACDDRGVDVLLTLPPAFPTHGTLEIAHVEGYPQPMLGMRRTPPGDVRLAFKRAMDIVVATIMLICAAPAMLAVAIAIHRTSPGNVLFRQVRAGRRGRPFTMYKFRSMVADAEAQREKLEHLNEMDGPVFKIRKDPRITPVGAFIRRTSLDELPQLFNVLLGHMSLVGPRPPLPSEVKQYDPWQRRRLSVKPGLTGLWQVSGRNDIHFEEWMQMDLRYIDNWSLWLDLKILWRTVPAVLARTGS